jgi:tRNA (guanine-N7-)-methyltransferase
MAPAPAKIADQAEIIPANFFAPLDFESIYGRIAPVEVDLGCGDGSYLVAAAGANPARNFLGIERMAGRVRSACRKIELGDVNNARILRCEISYAVGQMLPAKSVNVFHLMFPDPWPKRRHAPRRVVTESFLTLLHRALAPQGTVRIATDETDYFREIERLSFRSPEFVAIREPEAPIAASTFEKRFRQDGLQIHRIVLEKASDGT